MVTDEELRELYYARLQKVVSLGWDDDIEWSRQVSLDNINRVEFFKQYAFCVFASFSRWKVVNKK